MIFRYRRQYPYDELPKIIEILENISHFQTIYIYGRKELGLSIINIIIIIKKAIRAFFQTIIIQMNTAVILYLTQY